MPDSRGTAYIQLCMPGHCAGRKAGRRNLLIAGRNFAIAGRGDWGRKSPRKAAMMSFRLALAAFVLLAVPACAQPGPKTGMPGSGDGTCTVAELAQIDAAFVEAHAAIRHSLDLLEGDPAHPALRRWFGVTTGKLVRANFERMAFRAAQGRPADTTCRHPSACQGTSFAFTRPATGALGLCEPFFRAGPRGQDSRFGILVHEISHLAAGTRDTVYQPQRVLILAKEDPEAAAMNADNYEYLVESLYR